MGTVTDAAEEKEFIDAQCQYSEQPGPPQIQAELEQAPETQSQEEAKAPPAQKATKSKKKAGKKAKKGKTKKRPVTPVVIASSSESEDEQSSVQDRGESMFEPTKAKTNKK